MKFLFQVVVAVGILVLVLVHDQAQAENVKIATVDMTRIMNETKPALTKRKELDLKSAAAKKKLEEKQASLRSLEKNLKQAKVAEDSKEAENFRSQAREFSRMVKDTEEQLKKEFLKINKSLLDDTVAAIEKYAKNNSIDLVLEKSQAARGPVLFGDAGADITDKIVSELNR